jgi:hypothetical protein
VLGRNFWQQLAVYSQWSFQAVTIPTILAMFTVAAVSLALASVRQRPFRREVWHWSYSFVLTQLLFFPAIVAVGVLLPSTSGPSPQVNSVGEHWLDIMSYASLATGCFWVYKMKGIR